MSVSGKRRHVYFEELGEVGKVLTDKLIGAVCEHVFKLVITVLTAELSDLLVNGRSLDTRFHGLLEDPADMGKHFEIEAFDESHISIGNYERSIVVLGEF